MVFTESLRRWSLMDCLMNPPLMGVTPGVDPYGKTIVVRAASAADKTRPERHVGPGHWDGLMGSVVTGVAEKCKLTVGWRAGWGQL